MPLDPKILAHSTASPNVLSVSFTDVASGTGYIELLGGATSIGDSTSDDYFLSSIGYFGQPTFTTSAIFGAIGSPVQKLDIDFDVVLNKTLRINGNVIITCPVGAFRGGSSDSVTTFFVAKLRKWDGSTETELGEATSNSMTVSAATDTFATRAVTFNISDKTIKRGETLRITMEVWATATSTNTLNRALLGHDPQGRTLTGADSSKLIALIPTNL